MGELALHRSSAAMPKEEWPGEALMTLPYSIIFNPKITYPLPVLSTGSQPEKNILSLLADTLN